MLWQLWLPAQPVSTLNGCVAWMRGLNLMLLLLRPVPAVPTCVSGTLTKNEMTVVAMRSAGSKWTVSGVGYEPAGKFSIK